MKRDIELIRNIMLRMEQMSPRSNFNYQFEGFTEEDVHYHIYLLSDAGLIEATDASSMSQMYYMPTKITWAGQEFLDNAKNDKIWNKTKSKISEIGGSVSIAVLTGLLNKIALSLAGIG